MNTFEDALMIDQLAMDLPEPERSETRKKAVDIVQGAMNCKIDFMVAAKQLQELREALELAEIQRALTRA